MANLGIDVVVPVPSPGDVIALGRTLAESRRRRRADAKEALAHRLTLKKEFSSRLGTPMGGDSRAIEVIVRDLDRLDKYPQPDESSARRRISPWFRILVVGQYDSGLEVVGHPITAIIANGIARQTSEPGAETVWPGGRIPYLKIDGTDWSSDGHYSLPQIYCSFDRQAGPYESADTLVFRHHEDFDFYERLDSVTLAREKRSPRSAWADWRAHRRMQEDQRKFDAQLREERTRTRLPK